ncbi:hypothetical protein [Neorhizobium sp. DAR64862/K0K3]|uniref:hypothetical protein n=1 Tax=Neorhizobium sp. DAR64862/K0K3 TaxID=3421957 RepID=UPI003D2BFFC5
MFLPVIKGGWEMGYLLVAVLALSTPSTACLAAAHRYLGFLIQEAKGTRHEAQIQRSTTEAGGLDKKATELAQTLPETQCAFLFSAPDSTLRALAISNLPERSGN